MLIESIALLTSYAGVRWYENYRQRKISALSISYIDEHWYENYCQRKAKRENSVDKSTRKITDSHPATQTSTGKSPQNTDIIILHTDQFPLSTVVLGVTIAAIYLPILMPLSLGLIIYNGFIPMKRTEQLLRQGKIEHVTVVSSLYFFGLWGGQYIAVAVGGFFFHLGQYLGHKAQNYTQQELLHVFEHIPSTAWIEFENSEIEVPISELKMDDKVVVSTGGLIPVDGTILVGEGMADQRALTGEAQPAEKTVGDNVFAGTILIAGRIIIRIEKTGSETSLAKINDVLTQTIHFKPQAQLRGEILANQVAVPLLTVAGGTAFLLGGYGMLVVLSSSIGSSSGVIGSVGTLIHLNMASKAGILVKQGQGLEYLKDVDTVLFDKTGTLTQEEPLVANVIVTCSDITPADVLRYAAAAEQKLSHPIACALVNAANERGIILPDVDESDYELGRGIRANIEGQQVEVGSDRFMLKNGMTIPVNLQPLMEEVFERGDSLIFVALNQTIVGAIEIKAAIRPEAVETIQGLYAFGVKNIAIVSGDNRRPTEYLASQLGIDRCFYEVLPEEKSAIVEQLQAEGHKVCFVGDGINDAIAMSKADVSVSLHGASGIATDTAQIVLMDGTLEHLCTAFKISRKLDNSLKKHLNFMLLPLGVNIIGLYTLGIGVISAILFKTIVFLGGLANIVRPTLQYHQDHELNSLNSSSKLDEQ